LCCALFDGHGGDFVSSYWKKTFVKDVAPLRNRKSIQEYMNAVQTRLKKCYKRESKECGSTVLMARIKKRVVDIINLGDCRIIAGSTNSAAMIQLNREHKPDADEEKARITAAGETIEYDEEDELYRVAGYAVSRSLGDTNYPILSQTPDVDRIQLPENMSFIVMGTDGLWDGIGNQEVSRIVREKLKDNTKHQHTIVSDKDKSNIAFVLATAAYANGSPDNITVVVITIQ
jgi:serine/threonine protein phosphatase PrpC